MKMLLAALLLFTLTAQAQTWPRNPKTGKVEFRGVLPWPAGVKTEAQRRALVRRWYLAKLTDSSPTQVEAQAATNTTNGLLTYAGLPKATLLRAGHGDEALLLAFFVRLVAMPRGLAYQFTSFDCDRAADVEATEATPLEQLLLTATANQKAALAVLRKRLSVAVAGW